MGAQMTSLEGGWLCAGRDVMRAGSAAVRSPGGRGQAESPVSSRAGAGPERVSEAESKQARDPPFPSGSGASRSRSEPAAPARLRASSGCVPAPGSRGGRGGRDGAARAARLDGSLRSRRPAPSVLGLPAPRGAAFAAAGHLDAREMPNPKNSKGGRKNKRANSSGDEQENGAGALAAAGAAAGGALAAAAGCGAAAAGAPGTVGAAGAGGAGPGAANAAAAAGAAAAGEAKNGKTGPAVRAPTSSPTGTARRWGPGWRGRCVDNARVRKCSPRPSAPPRLPLPGPHARRWRSIGGHRSVSAGRTNRAPRAA